MKNILIYAILIAIISFLMFEKVKNEKEITSLRQEMYKKDSILSQNTLFIENLNKGIFRTKFKTSEKDSLIIDFGTKVDKLGKALGLLEPPNLTVTDSIQTDILQKIENYSKAEKQLFKTETVYDKAFWSNIKQKTPQEICEKAILWRNQLAQSTFNYSLTQESNGHKCFNGFAIRIIPRKSVYRVGELIKADVGMFSPIPIDNSTLYANGKKVPLEHCETYFEQIADTKNNKVHFEWHLRNPLTGQIYTQDIDYTFAILPENK